MNILYENRFATTGQDRGAQHSYPLYTRDLTLSPTLINLYFSINRREETDSRARTDTGQRLRLRLELRLLTT